MYETCGQSPFWATKYTVEEKSIISHQIKPIDSIDLHNDWHKLIKIRNNDLKCPSRCRTGLKVVDYFTFEERLHTKGKYNVNYFEFISNIDYFKRKKIIHNMLIYYEKIQNKKIYLYCTRTCSIFA
jgi:hypothetical protein